MLAYVAAEKVVFLKVVKIVVAVLILVILHRQCQCMLNQKCPTLYTFSANCMKYPYNYTTIIFTYTTTTYKI